MSEGITYHYPPELFGLMVDALPRLIRSKRDILIFFEGAGVAKSYMSDIAAQIDVDRESVKKHDMVRTVLKRLNDRGDGALRERREVLRRVYDWEDFSGCWEGDRLVAIGLVESIRKLVDKKDAFTRMAEEREEARRKAQDQEKTRLAETQRKRDEIDAVRRDLCLLVGATNPQRRGKDLEAILNRLFRCAGVLIKESFAVEDASGSVITEQIDGAVEIDGHVYLVEMKWHSGPIGVDMVNPHISRIHMRDGARAIIISASGYTQSALLTCREALSHKVVVLCTLQELVMLLERQGDLQDFLRAKVREAIVSKNPFLEILY